MSSQHKSSKYSKIETKEFTVKLLLFLAWECFLFINFNNSSFNITYFGSDDTTGNIELVKIKEYLSNIFFLKGTNARHEKVWGKQI